MGGKELRFTPSSPCCIWTLRERSLCHNVNKDQSVDKSSLIQLSESMCNIYFRCHKHIFLLQQKKSLKLLCKMLWILIGGVAEENETVFLGGWNKGKGQVIIQQIINITSFHEGVRRVKRQTVRLQVEQKFTHNTEVIKERLNQSPQRRTDKLTYTHTYSPLAFAPLTYFYSPACVCVWGGHTNRKIVDSCMYVCVKSTAVKVLLGMTSDKS